MQIGKNKAPNLQTHLSPATRPLWAWVPPDWETEGYGPSLLHQAVPIRESDLTHEPSVRTFRLFLRNPKPGTPGVVSSPLWCAPRPCPEFALGSPACPGRPSPEPRTPLGAQRSVLGLGCGGAAGWPRASPRREQLSAGRRGGGGAAPCGEEGGRAAPAELPPPLQFMAPEDPPGSSPRSSGLGSFYSRHAHSF